MADSPFIPIKIDNMNIYFQSELSGNSSPQTSADNSLQSTVVNQYNRPVTAEQTVRELQRNGYFADIQTTVDEENYISPDELQETPRLMYLSLVKSSQKIKTTTKTIYTQDMFGRGGIGGMEQKTPAVKNQFSAICFAEFIVSEASTVYVENGYTYDK